MSSRNGAALLCLEAILEGPCDFFNAGFHAPFVGQVVNWLPDLHWFSDCSASGSCGLLPFRREAGDVSRVSLRQFHG